MSPRTIHPGEGARKKSKRVGRGNASQKGTTAARGTKGQRARSGGKSRTKILGFRQSLLKIPKSRGFKSLSEKTATVSLVRLQPIVTPEQIVTPAFLKQKNLVHSNIVSIKLVGSSFDKKIAVKGCLASKAALQAIEKAGGTVTF